MNDSTPQIPLAVNWQTGMMLDAAHFQLTDRRSAGLAHLAALAADPWRYGFTDFRVDDVALAGGQFRVDCEGVFPDGQPFRRARLSHALPKDEGDNARANLFLRRNPDSDELSLQVADVDAPAVDTLPAARLLFRRGAWSLSADWSPPVLFAGPDHPLRQEVGRKLGGLSALGLGITTTLRMPGAEHRPAAQTLSQVVTALVQGVGVMDSMLRAPMVVPSQLGMEALRLALGVRSAAGIFDRLEVGWDPADQRATMRNLLDAAEAAVSGIGLPYRMSSFRSEDGVLVVRNMPAGALLLVVEVSRPADLMVARAWLDGAALAAPDRIREALVRRVSGCARRPIERDPSVGVSSGPLIALYRVEDDPAWRRSQPELALASEAPLPPNTSFSMLITEEEAQRPPPLLEAPTAHVAWGDGSRNRWTGDGSA